MRLCRSLRLLVLFGWMSLVAFARVSYCCWDWRRAFSTCFIAVVSMVEPIMRTVRPVMS